ncbi:MAG: SBBP repeat-containing protein [Blastocatellia bacterium]
MKCYRKYWLLAGCSGAVLFLTHWGMSQFLVRASFSAPGFRQVAPQKAIKSGQVTSPLAPLTLHFEKNQGQYPTALQFAARGKGFQVGITANEMVLCFAAASSHAPTSTPEDHRTRSLRTLRLQLQQAQAAPVLEGVNPLAARTNYFRGKNAAQWHTEIQNYEQVRARNVYPGINLVYYGTPAQLEYDFEVAPGADPQRIAIALHGAERLRLSQEGDLVIKVGSAELRHKKPVAYQLINGTRHEVEARYQVSRHHTIRFQLGHYDATQPLVIDPVLIYSTLLGGSFQEGATLIRTDAAGNLYVLGDTQSADFPVANAAQPNKSEAPTPWCATSGGCGDVFISKFDPTGRQLLFSTYLGGTFVENGLGMAVDSQGNVYVTGTTYSGDFPTTPGCFQSDRKGSYFVGQDVFVTKLSASGSVLVYSTYLGGSDNDRAFNLAIDAQGNAYIAGRTDSRDFPTKNPLRSYQEDNGGRDGFVAKLNAWGTELIYSTYLGGDDVDQCNDIKVDADGNAYVTGSTASDDFPTTFGAYQSEWAGSDDVFVCKINPTGSAFVFSTLVGGAGGDIATSLALDAKGNVYVVGYSGSFDGDFTFPLVNPLQKESVYYPGYDDATDVIVFELNATGTDLLYATYLGGAGRDDSYGAFVVDEKGRIYLSGNTESLDFPVTPDAIQPVFGGGFQDAFVSILDPSQPGIKALVYSSYLGGSGRDLGQSVALDPQGNLYVCGYTQLLNPPHTFPLVNAQQSELKGLADAFITKISLTSKDSSDVIPPAIAITVPTTAPAFTVASDRITLAGTASDNVGVTQVLWRKAQKQTELDSGPMWGVAKGTTDWKIENLYLQQGENQIRVAARDQAGNVTETSITIQCQPEYLIKTIAGGGATAARDDLPPLEAKFRFPFSPRLTPTGDLLFADLERRQIWKLALTGKLTRVAGTGQAGSTGDGGPALQATLNSPSSLALDKQGQLYIAEDGTNIVRMIDTTGVIRTVAGDRSTVGCNFGGDGGPATAAQFCSPRSLAFNSRGELFVADTFNNRIRKIDSQGIVTTIAGNGTDGTTGDGGPALDAQISAPHSLVFDTQGNLFFCTQERIRKITATGTISTFAGGGADYFGDGIPASAVNLGSTGGLAFDTGGNLWVASSGAEVLRRINPAGIVERMAGRWETGFSGDGGAARLARLSSPGGIATDGQGRVYFADTENKRIRVVFPAGASDTVAPTVTVTAPTKSGVYQAAVPVLSLQGTASDNSEVARVLWSNDRGGQGTARGTAVWTVEGVKLANGPNRFTFTAIDAGGNQATATLTVTYDPDQTPPTIAITAPTTAATYTASDVYVTLRGSAADDRQLAKVWWRDSAGHTGIIAGTTQWQLPDFLVQTGDTTVTVFAEDGAGNVASDSLTIHYEPEYLLYTMAGPGVAGTLDGAGNGGPATKAYLSPPVAVAFDASQTLYFVEQPNNHVRKITPEGVIFPFAGGGGYGKTGNGIPALEATFNEPQAILAAPDGSVYIADTNNHLLRQVTPDGLIKTVAGVGTFGFSNDGGLATAAQLFYPRGMILDAAGNLLFADSSNHRIRKITPAGIISTIAGSASPGFSGDGGEATAARLGRPHALAFDAAKNLYFTDTDNSCIRKITPNGIITTVAGQGGKEGFAGDGGPAVNALLDHPVGLAIDAQGNLFIADTLNHRIRRVDAKGIITTIAGLGPTGFTVGRWNGDGMAATLARLNLPSGITLDRAGNLYIADYYNFRLRKLVPNAQAAPRATNVPATHYQGTTLAPESLVSAFGQNLAPGTDAAQSLPLPAILQGTRVWVRDSEGYEHPAPLLFVSPTQINYQLPKEVKVGSAQIIIENEQGRRAAGVITVQPLSAGIFSASSDGVGPAAASLLRIKVDGTRSSEQCARYDAARQQFVTIPIDLGPVSEQVFIELYGSGFRNRSELGEVQARIGGVPVEVLYAGAQGAFIGLDQVNLRLPRSLAGRGEVAIELTIRGTPTNPVKINIK